VEAVVGGVGIVGVTTTVVVGGGGGAVVEGLATSGANSIAFVFEDILLVVIVIK
jgi:hypothetical protein